MKKRSHIFQSKSLPFSRIFPEQPNLIFIKTLLFNFKIQTLFFYKKKNSYHDDQISYPFFPSLKSPPKNHSPCLKIIKILLPIYAS